MKVLAAVMLVSGCALSAACGGDDVATARTVITAGNAGVAGRAATGGTSTTAAGTSQGGSANLAGAAGSPIAGEAGKAASGGSSADGGEPAAGGTASDGGTATDGGMPAVGGSGEGGGAEPAAGGSPSAGGTPPGGGRANAGGTAGGQGGAAGACSTVYYLDADGDSWGGATTACSPGSAGTWVTRGGDCDDDNADVHPNQQSFFAEAYLPSDGGEASFDYNCSGDEEMQGMNRSSTGTCAPAGTGSGCDGTGYLPAEPARSGDGVDPTCGSTRYLTCERVQGVCTASEGTAAAATCR